MKFQIKPLIKEKIKYYNCWRDDDKFYKNFLQIWANNQTREFK